MERGPLRIRRGVTSDWVKATGLWLLASEETGPGEAPVFEVVETDLEGIVDFR